MASHGHGHSTHVFPISMYGKNLLALLFLMGLTILAAQFNFAEHFKTWGLSPALGSWVNNIIAMTIAVIKAVLVISFFMHVKFGSNLVKLWAMAGFVWFTLMFFIFMDYGTRQYEPAPAFDPQDRGSALNRQLERTGENPPVDKQPFVRPRW